MKDEFKTVTWSCFTPGCDAMVTQRFHVATDGDPGRALPPQPWTVEVGQDIGKAYYCADCSAQRRAEQLIAEVPGEVTFEDCVSQEEVAEVWEREHRCLMCENIDICKMAPTPNGYPHYVTVSRCASFVCDPNAESP